MSNSSAADSLHLFSVSPPHQISKDVQGSNNPIPLSPQWLQPKYAETKPGMGIGDSHSPYPAQGSHTDIMEPSGNGEGMHDIPKKKDKICVTSGQTLLGMVTSLWIKGCLIYRVTGRMSERGIIIGRGDPTILRFEEEETLFITKHLLRASRLLHFPTAGDVEKIPTQHFLLVVEE
ncbi:hypothetical protein SLEP1_g38771 [Rubroshorea leprosula]|uniref:Uncharacterized protein n=1 Tax=Rubroshorea leprosula TaxID=152421 RepID=A0AAV5KY79_9ROSI|nr:hypothetical protein SLEP1_g38771 [Rubroshorea leprosula]